MNTGEAADSIPAVDAGDNPASEAQNETESTMEITAEPTDAAREVADSPGRPDYGGTGCGAVQYLAGDCLLDGGGSDDSDLVSATSTTGIATDTADPPAAAIETAEPQVSEAADPPAAAIEMSEPQVSEAADPPAAAIETAEPQVSEIADPPAAAIEMSEPQVSEVADPPAPAIEMSEPQVSEVADPPAPIRVEPNSEDEPCAPEGLNGSLESKTEHCSPEAQRTKPADDSKAVEEPVPEANHSSGKSQAEVTSELEAKVRCLCDIRWLVH